MFDKKLGVPVVYLPLEVPSGVYAWERATSIVETALREGDKSAILRFFRKFFLPGTRERYWIEFLADRLDVAFQYVVQADPPSASSAKRADRDLPGSSWGQKRYCIGSSCRYSGLKSSEAGMTQDYQSLSAAPPGHHLEGLFAPQDRISELILKPFRVTRPPRRSPPPRAGRRTGPTRDC